MPQSFSVLSPAARIGRGAFCLGSDADFSVAEFACMVGDVPWKDIAHEHLDEDAYLEGLIGAG